MRVPAKSVTLAWYLCIERLGWRGLWCVWSILRIGVIEPAGVVQLSQVGPLELTGIAGADCAAGRCVAVDVLSLSFA